MVATNNSSAKDRVASLMMTSSTVFTIAIALMLPASTNSVSTEASFPRPTSSINKASFPSESRDFTEFNKLFENASIVIPEKFKVSEQVGFTDLDMNIWNIKCYDMSVGDISVDHEQKSDTEFFATVGVKDLDLTCEMNYDYSYGILSGDGWVQIQTENSEALSSISFISPDFDQNPPTNSAVENCFSDVEIKHLDFEEDFASEVLEVFQGLIRNTVEQAIGDVACEELSVIGTGVVGNMVNMAADQLEPYLGHLGEAATDPLYLEHNLVLPDSLEALNLQDAEGEIGNAFNEILEFFDVQLGKTVFDSSKGSDTLLINSLLRSFFLDDDGAFRLDPSTVSTMTNPILFEGHDRITEFTVILDEVRLYGLDSITRFNSFRNIGIYTLQNELTWDLLKFEFDIILDIKPSTLDDAILMHPTSAGISEHFVIDFTLNNIDVEASLLLVLDEVAMRSMELGSLFFTENHLPCLLSLIHEVGLSGLDVDPSYINDGPTVNGFVSSGLDGVISDSLEAAFAMYKGSLRLAIPNLFQSSVREFINIFLADAFIDDKVGIECLQPQSFEEGNIDFRKFFDAEDGSYGDLPSMMKSMINDKFLTINPETGRPRINEALVAPLTGAQSGSEGTLAFPIDLFTFPVPTTTSQKFGLETVELRLFDPKFENLDTIGMPIQLLEPNAVDGQVLDNFATFGSISRKLRIGLKGLFAMGGDPTFTMTNEMDMFVELAGSDALVSLMANVDASTLFNFPLMDITNLQCWLNTIATPGALGDGNEIQFSILDALLTTESMAFNVTCSTCTSQSLSILPNILGSLESFGVSDTVEKRTVTLITNLLRSNYTQDYINGILMDAALRCPHSPKFIDSSASFSENSTMKFPSLDYESLETIVFVSAVVTEVAAIIIAQAHESYDLETSFPLSGQYDLNVANNVRLVDFTLLEASPEKSVLPGIDNFNEFLNEVVSDPNGLSSNSALRVNSLIQSLFLEDNGEFSVTFDGLNVKNLGIGISMKEVNIAGLDTISELNIFDAIGAQTIQNQIRWEKIHFQAVLSIEAASGSPLSKEQNITISVELSDVNLSLALLMAIDLDLFESLEMWSIMDLKNILPCVMSTVEAASFTEMELSIGSISDFSIEGFDSREVSFSANQSSQMILETYGDKIVSSIPKVFDSTVRNLLNNWLKYQMENLPSDLCKYSSSGKTNDSGFVDLRDLLWAPSVASRLGGTGLSQYGDMFRLLNGMFQDIIKINSSSGLSAFNQAVVEPLTKAKGNELGAIHYSGDLFKGENRLKVGALDTNIQFRAYDAKIENLNTIGAPLELFSGINGEAYMLNNTLTAGVGEKPLQFSSKILLSLEGDDNIDISNEVDLSLEFTNASIIVSSLTKILKTRLFGFPLRDVFDLNCWLAAIPAPALDTHGVRTNDSVLTASLSYLKAEIGELNMKANCTNCTSPRMTEWTDLLSSPEARNETTAVANALLDYVTQLMGGSFLQVQIDRVLNEAARKCPHSPSYDPNAKPLVYEEFEAPNPEYSVGRLILLTVLALAFVIIVLTLAFTVKCIVRRRHRKWLLKLPPHQIKSLSKHQKSKQSFEDTLNITTRSMCQSPDVPRIIRFMMPIVIILNILFFLSGHLSLGATVNVEAEVAGEQFAIQKFFEFSMARSTIDIWKAGGHELAILILIFSGIWPYSKLLITLWLWFSSPSNVSISRRGSILLWLDWLAKWSMIDIFVLVISIAAFRISIESPDASYLPNDFYVIEMMVVPLWGLYANMIAQLMSQITSHIIIHYHRRIVTKATDRLNQGHSGNAIPATTIEMQTQSQDPESLSSVGLTASVSTPKSSKEDAFSLSLAQFSRPHRGETEKLVVRAYVNKLLTFCAFMIVVCVVIGCSLPSFSLELFGLVGVAVEYGQDFEDATFNHSVFSVIKLLFDQASYLGAATDYLGLTVLSILFVSTILFVPIIQSMTLLSQWFSVSTKKQKQKIAIRLEILQAWQYLEVYAVALFISSWQLGKVSDFMINSYCKSLEDTFARMVYFGILKEEDAQCFGVTSHIGPNAFILVAGAVLLSFLSSFVCKAFIQYLRDETLSKLHSKGNGDSSISEASTSNDDDDATGASVSDIHQVPVLFTDTFRWMLRTSKFTNHSNRTLVLDPHNSHWSLPEATVVSSESSPPRGKIMKGTYVHDLPSTGKGDRTASGGLRQGSFDLASTLSFDSYQSSPREKELNYNDDIDKRQSYRVSLGQQSVSSKMDSIGSTSNGESFDANSLVQSVDTNFSIESPPTEALSNTRFPGAFRRAPPPENYRLSAKSQLKPPPSYPSTTDIASDQQNERHLKKAPPVSSSHVSSESECIGRTLFVDDDDEYSTVKSISDIMNEVDNGTDEHFDDCSFSTHSVSHKRII